MTSDAPVRVPVQDAPIQDAPIMRTYGATRPATFLSGRGCVLVDDDGREYLDFLAGLGVVAAGHCHPDVATATADQAARLVHVSNLFWTEPASRLAYRLHGMTGWGKCFFGNSGAEANECAIKLVRKWAGLGRYKVVSARPSFHGRTLAALAATGQPDKWEGFEPLPEGFVHAPFNDLDGFADAVDAETAAIMVEPILGESGVVPADPDFLHGLRELCDEHGIALVFDEVQTGMGRTGRWWAHQSYGVRPDVFTNAKGLANGLPIGVCVASDDVASAFGPGDHGSTFGGNPVACAAAIATIDVLEDGGFVETVEARGALLAEHIAGHPAVLAVRGRGLLLAAVLGRPNATDVVAAALQLGLIVNAPAPDVVRFAPPLVVSEDEILEAAGRFGEALDSVEAK